MPRNAIRAETLCHWATTAGDAPRPPATRRTTPTHDATTPSTPRHRTHSGDRTRRRGRRGDAGAGRDYTDAPRTDTARTASVRGAPPRRVDPPAVNEAAKAKPHRRESLSAPARAHRHTDTHTHRGRPAPAPLTRHPPARARPPSPDPGATTAEDDTTTRAPAGGAITFITETPSPRPLRRTTPPTGGARGKRTRANDRPLSSLLKTDLLTTRVERRALPVQPGGALKTPNPSRRISPEAAATVVGQHTTSSPKTCSLTPPWGRPQRPPICFLGRYPSIFHNFSHGICPGAADTTRLHMTHSIGIGLAGFGTVGAGVYKNLAANGDLLAQRLGARFDVRRIAVRDLGKARDVGAPAELFSHRSR